MLGYTTITAPLDGRTGIRMVDEGNYVRSADVNSAIVVITQLRPISVLFNLPQQELPQLNKGMIEGPMPIDALGPTGRPVDKGKVLVIDNQVDPTTGTVKLKAEFPNASLQLWPGQFINVALTLTTQSDAVVVPAEAIQVGPEGQHVFVVKPDNSVEVRPVVVARTDGGEAVIAQGLQSGEQIVREGQFLLSAGSKVEIKDTNQERKASEAKDRKKDRAGKTKAKAQEGGES